MQVQCKINVLIGGGGGGACQLQCRSTGYVFEKLVNLCNNPHARHVPNACNPFLGPHLLPQWWYPHLRVDQYVCWVQTNLDITSIQLCFFVVVFIVGIYHFPTGLSSLTL